MISVPYTGTMRRMHITRVPMRTLYQQQFGRARSVASPLAAFVALVSFWSFLYAMTLGWTSGDTGRSSTTASRVLGIIGQLEDVDGDGRTWSNLPSPGFREDLVCPYCRSSFIQSNSKRTCEQRIHRLLRQNNGLGAIGAKLSYLEAAIAVAARKDLTCRRCDPAACSDEDKRFYHMNEVGPKILQTVEPSVRVEHHASRVGSYSPHFSQMTLVNPSCTSIPNGLVGDNAAFLCLFSLIDPSCKRDKRGSHHNATHYLGVSVLDTTLSNIGKDGVFEANSEWTLVTDEQDVLYLASASIQIPLVIADDEPRRSAVLKRVASSPTGTVGLHALASLPLERHHRVDPRQLAAIIPSFGTSDELSKDGDTTVEMGVTPIAIACCAEVTWDKQKLLVGVAGYRQASSIFAMNDKDKIVALTGKFCFTPDCNSHRVHSISRHNEGELLLAYEERCSSMLLVLDTADVLRMLFSPHRRLLD